MSGGLAPSKSTVYVSNLLFSLTNNDLHKIFEKYGRVVKVTVVKDKYYRKSKGVAFVLFLDRESAQKCVRALDRQQLFGRTIKCSIAHDNGRTTEFIKKKIYKEKSRCYECGLEGHLSYNCPKNSLGDREPPKKREKRRKFRKQQEEELEETIEEEEEEQEQEMEDPSLDTLSAAIRYQQEKMEEEEYRLKVATGSYDEPSTSETAAMKRKRIKKDSYFSDEEQIEDD